MRLQLCENWGITLIYQKLILKQLTLELPDNLTLVPLQKNINPLSPSRSPLTKINATTHNFWRYLSYKAFFHSIVEDESNGGRLYTDN